MWYNLRNPKRKEILTLQDNFANSALSVASCPRFSIIVPVYNTEKYIARCLDSLVNQDITERNYEILITDDGSTDQSRKICDDYAAKYPFIHVTHTSNHGVSHARNIAIEKCRGEYIMFCDADDFVSPQLVSIITKAVEVLDSPDMVIYNYYYREFSQSGWPVYDIEAVNANDADCLNFEEVCMEILTPSKKCCRVSWYGGFICNKIIKRKLIQNIAFDENMRILEDERFWLEILSGTRITAYHLDYSLYCYIQRENGSITKDTSQSNLIEYVNAREGMLNICGLAERVAETLKGLMYTTSLQETFAGSYISSNGRKNIDSYKVLRSNISKYARDFYASSCFSFSKKLKQFIKHILVFLHIHKPRR